MERSLSKRVVRRKMHGMVKSIACDSPFSIAIAQPFENWFNAQKSDMEREIIRRVTLSSLMDMERRLRLIRARLNSTIFEEEE